MIKILSLTPRFDDLDNKVNEVNNCLVKMCNERNIPFISHSLVVRRDAFLSKNGLYLKRYWEVAFAKNVTTFLLELKDAPKAFC